MKIKGFISLLAGISLFATVSAADKLAVAEPVGRGGVTAAEIDGLWGILEVSIKSDEYSLISRNALKQMMTEIGLTTSSDLVNLNSSQKAKLGQLATVKYILVSEIIKFGSRYNCVFKIMDSSTGEIDQARTANLRVKDFDELADRIEAVMQRLLSDNKKSNQTAILLPVIRASGAPSYLGGEFCARLEQALLSHGARLQNLQNVVPILRKNNLGRLSEADPDMYVKIGKVLRVKTLVLPVISCYEFFGRKYNVEETGARGVRWSVRFEGYIRVISAQDGSVIASVAFDEFLRLRDLDRRVTRDWNKDDYCKYMLRSVISQKIVPELIKVPAVKGK